MKLFLNSLRYVMLALALLAACGPDEQDKAAADILRQNAAQQDRLLDDLRDERADAQSATNMLVTENQKLVGQLAQQQQHTQEYVLKSNAQLLERQNQLEDKLLDLTGQQTALFATLTLALVAVSVTLGAIALAALVLAARRRHPAPPVYLPGARGYGFLPDGSIKIIHPNDMVLSPHQHDLIEHE